MKSLQGIFAYGKTIFILVPPLYKNTYYAFYIKRMLKEMGIKTTIYDTNRRDVKDVSLIYMNLVDHIEGRRLDHCFDVILIGWGVNRDTFDKKRKSLQNTELIQLKSNHEKDVKFVSVPVIISKPMQEWQASIPKMAPNTFKRQSSNFIYIQHSPEELTQLLNDSKHFTSIPEKVTTPGGSLEHVGHITNERPAQLRPLLNKAAERISQATGTAIDPVKLKKSSPKIAKLLDEVLTTNKVGRYVIFTNYAKIFGTKILASVFHARNIKPLIITHSTSLEEENETIDTFNNVRPFEDLKMAESIIKSLNIKDADTIINTLKNDSSRDAVEIVTKKLATLLPIKVVNSISNTFVKKNHILITNFIPIRQLKKVDAVIMLDTYEADIAIRLSQVCQPAEDGASLKVVFLHLMDTKKTTNDQIEVSKAMAKLEGFARDYAEYSKLFISP